MDGFDQLMSVFFVIAGGLGLYYAIAGKAPGFNMDYPKEMKADAEKMLRKFCFFLGPLAIAMGVLEMIPGLEWTYWVGLCIMLPSIVVYIVLFRRKFRQYLKKR